MQIQIDKEQKEIKNHGSYEFPVLLSPEALSNFDTESFQWHWHSEIELTLILDGEIEYQVNETLYHLKQGDGLFCNTNVLHSGHKGRTQDCRYLSITFHPRFLYGYGSSVIQRKYVNPILKNPRLAAIHFTPEQAWMQQVIAQLQALQTIQEMQAEQKAEKTRETRNESERIGKSRVAREDREEAGVHRVERSQEAKRLEKIGKSQGTREDREAAGVHRIEELQEAGKSLVTENLYEEETQQDISTLQAEKGFNMDSMEIQVQIALLTIWRLIYENVDYEQEQTTETSLARDTERIRKIIAYIQEHYMEAVSLERLAEEIHLCRSESCRLFKRYMNETIFDYLTRFRIEKSLEFLRDRSLSITDVAEKAGFASPAYFSSMFRKKMGCTPGAYRKKL